MPLFKDLGDKHCPLEIEKIGWSPTVDLLALSTSKGDLFMQRLFWKKAWHIPAPDDGAKIASFCWSPCGCYFVLAYASGRVLICHIENGKVTHELTIPDSSDNGGLIVDLLWSAATTTPDHSLSLFGSRIPALHPRLPKLDSSANDTSSESFFLSAAHASSPPNILLVSVTPARFLFFAYGFFHFATFDLQSVAPSASVPLSASFNTDLSRLLICSQSSGIVYSLLRIAELDAHRSSNLRAIFLRMGELFDSLAYLEKLVDALKNSWEDVLLEIDKKFVDFARKKYDANRKTGGVDGEDGETIGDDMLQLLIFGVVSAELEHFLLHDLSEKGLKKLGISVENTYSTIQDLASNMNAVAHALFFHLNEMRRLIGEGPGRRRPHTSSSSSPQPSQLVDEAAAAARALFLKSAELQAVIVQSLGKFKAFFRWIYAAIVNVGGGAPSIPTNSNQPSTSSKAIVNTAEDVRFVASFIEENFLRHWSPGADTSALFRLEKVGQYLRDAPLAVPFDRSKTIWTEMQASADTLDSEERCSLIQQQLAVHAKIERLAKAICESVSRKIRVVVAGRSLLPDGGDSVVRKCVSSFAEGAFWAQGGGFCVFFLDANGTTIRRVGIDALTGVIRWRACGGYARSGEERIIDFSLYADSRLALLTRPPPGRLVLHTCEALGGVIAPNRRRARRRAPLRVVQPVENVGEVEEDWSLDIEDSMVAQTIEHRQGDALVGLCVSGKRKVGCLLYASKTQLKLVELEPEPDEQEEEGIDDDE